MTDLEDGEVALEADVNMDGVPKEAEAGVIESKERRSDPETNNSGKERIRERSRDAERHSHDRDGRDGRDRGGRDRERDWDRPVASSVRDHSTSGSARRYDRDYDHRSGGSDRQYGSDHRRRDDERRRDSSSRRYDDRHGRDYDRDSRHSHETRRAGDDPHGASDRRRYREPSPAAPPSPPPPVMLDIDLEDESEDEEEKIARMREKRKKLLEKLDSAAPTRTASPITVDPASTTQPQQDSTLVRTQPPTTQPPTRTTPPPSPPPTTSKPAAVVADMFGAESPIELLTLNAATTAPNTAAKGDDKGSTTGENASLMDNWDDSEGYYRARPGELLHGTYRVKGYSNKGVFSSVLRAVDERSSHLVAIKVIRGNTTMFKAGEKEYEVLRTLQREDPDGRYHCVRMMGKFEHHNHLCLVFEHFSMNLREVIRKYGGGVGLNMAAVRSYAQQLFLALRLIKRCKFIHADIKPDNILVDSRNVTIKMCDFGSAMGERDVQITPYLVTRYYRAPEIMLGLTYGYAIDMWAIACTLYELYTGRILFAGHTNNDMLKLQQDVVGRIPKRMLRSAQLRQAHFDLDGNFLHVVVDKVTGNKTIKVIDFGNGQPSVDLHRLLLNDQVLSDDERLELRHFKELLEAALCIDPQRRLTPEAALKHAFFKRNVDDKKKT